uniref:Uncharacterized protein n=1 Tax=Caenorhabditis japonica TaxID=281687 RepID=A0A8R1HSU6_CAEJA
MCGAKTFQQLLALPQYQPMNIDDVISNRASTPNHENDDPTNRYTLSDLDISEVVEREFEEQVEYERFHEDIETKMSTALDISSSPQVSENVVALKPRKSTRVKRATVHFSPQDPPRRKNELTTSLLGMIEPVTSPGANHFSEYKKSRKSKKASKIVQPKVDEKEKEERVADISKKSQKSKRTQNNVKKKVFQDCEKPSTPKSNANEKPPSYLKPTVSSAKKAKMSPEMTQKTSKELQLVPRDIILPGPPNDNSLRRSKRVRVEPLRFWLGEAPVYVTSPGGGRRLRGVTDVVIEDKKVHEFQTPLVKLATEERKTQRHRRVERIPNSDEENSGRK